ncbi:hypothetical protein NC652_004888 [Populus alba x Populus x berolinensis]|nr:hypothetical protein NC652_004888 [Populus alba x Populus x berolinensis]
MALDRFREGSKIQLFRFVDMESSYLYCGISFEWLPSGSGKMEEIQLPQLSYGTRYSEKDALQEDRVKRVLIYVGKKLSQLLDEDPALMERRQQCAKRLELYKAARDEVDSVSWAR